MSNTHIAGKPNDDGDQHCTRCGMLMSISGLFKPGAFVLASPHTHNISWPEVPEDKKPCEASK